jgi:hypothetical protein
MTVFRRVRIVVRALPMIPFHSELGPEPTVLSIELRGCIVAMNGTGSSLLANMLP